MHRGFVTHANDHHLDWRERGRHDETLVITVGHDQSSHESRRRSPRRRVAEFGRTGFALVDDVERPREVLSEFVTRGHLQRLAVAHHALAGERIDRARETLARAA